HEGAWLSLVPPVSGGAPEPAAVPGVSVVVTEAPLDAAAALAAVSDPGAGGTVLFQGTPRDVDALDFEIHAELAERELTRIGADLAARHGLHAIALHHRFGRVPAAEAAILVVAAAAHRGPAFEAARDALDEVKRRVPIWKTEVVGEDTTPVDGEVVAGVRTVADHLGARPDATIAHDGAAPGTPGLDPGTAPGPGGLTHLAADGSARMVDVSDKAITDRRARAIATVRVTPSTAALIAAGNMPKGEVLATARLAGIMAAKRTAELIPLAHPLPLTKIDVSATVDQVAGEVHLEGFARTTGKTGVEIEALTAVLIAALTVYDMVKAIEQQASIEGVRVVEKAGGRRDFSVDGAGSGGRAAARSAHQAGGAASDQRPTMASPVHQREAMPLTIAAVHVSTSRTAGRAPDLSRAALAAFTARAGWTVAHETMVSDDRAGIAQALRDAAAMPGVELVLTLGGTGLTPDDVTPEATLDVIDREAPGLAEALRAASMAATPMASLSRGRAGTLGAVVIVNLPGSPKAIAELEPLLTAVLPHAVAQAGRPVKP
ncbi:MAG: bifunctional molybdenum cofactor biosynthesis protein MoaC/MoaB, partial [Solirubrobacteraceae bacterium]|nr:bifunctional molybdenum cofactor biosynthesis protein MoaC/MoaB [Solirubrobacteraceae bacterium]